MPVACTQSYTTDIERERGVNCALIHVSPDDILEALGEEAPLDDQPLLPIQISLNTQLLYREVRAVVGGILALLYWVY